MSQNPLRHIGSILPTLKRCVWLSMVAAHSPALIGAWRSVIASGFAAEDLGGCAGLSLAMLFFVLKLFGATWLQFHLDRRAWIAVCLIIALIHVDCMRPNSQKTGPRQWAVVAAVTALIADPTRVARALGAALANLRSAGADNLAACRANHTVWLDLILPHCRLLQFHYGAPRSPPSMLRQSRATR